MIGPWAAPAALPAAVSIVPGAHAHALQADPTDAEDKLRVLSKEWVDAEVAHDCKAPIASLMMDFKLPSRPARG